MAYGFPANEANRLDFLSQSICKSDTTNQKTTNIHHDHAHSSPQGHHDHCLQGCFLCAFCLSYRDLIGNFSPINPNGHLIVWLPIVYQKQALDYASNQARAPPISITK